MEFIKGAAVLLALSLCLDWSVQAQPANPQAAANQVRFGAQGAEAGPNRRQDWVVPSPDLVTVSRAILYRPEGKGPFRIALIAHASAPGREGRRQMPQPEYRALAAALVVRGFAVLVPQRPGHGKTGGPYIEDHEGCDNAEYVLAGNSTADSIATALAFIRTQPFARKDAAVVVGHSAGGWGALSLADRGTRDIASVIVFAPGRGGHANNRADTVCAPEKLIAAAREFGSDARTPVTWLVAENDSYFSPEFSKRMADAFRDAGGKADFRVLSAFGEEGHLLAEADDQALIDGIVGSVAGMSAVAPIAQTAASKSKK